MNRLLPFLFIIFVFFLSANAQKTQVLLAQNSVGKLKASIAKKEDAKKQLSILGEGIKAIEAAQKDKKTKNWPETWAIKSYLSSYVAVIDANEANSDRYYDLAVKALDTAKILDKFQANSELIKASTYNINVKKLTEGNKAYSQNDFLMAYTILKDVSDYLPKDTILATNVGLCAQKIQNYNKALTYFLRAKENGVRNPIVHQTIANLYVSSFENELAIKSLEDGLKLNPENPLLTNDYINLLLDNEKYEKAIKAINGTLGTERRSSKLLYFLFGYLQQSQLKNYTEAETAYKKALALDQNYFDAMYQLALVYVSNANEALKQNNKPKFTSFANRAEFTLLRAHEININDLNTIHLLIEVYTRKNRLDKVQELKRKLNEF
ncbi:tetratricopeptide repeat protein [Pedobacter sp. Du54]|uniref:tetratricopeptide repeat protein n=1 Tax=Pedobacter anseongensis TaxID=3133439 RepID=UPI0030A24EC4